MAQSRRRERELARRKFERRRMAQMQQRELQRKRNNVIGAIVGVIVVVGAIVGIGFAVLGGSNPKPKATSPLSTSTSPATTSSTSASPAPTTEVAKATKTCKTPTPNPPSKGEPMIPAYKGKIGSKLIVNDIKKGTGAVAKKGDSVTVKYVGAGCSSGKVFDASYTDGQPGQEFTFTLGIGQVIPGWDQGVAGMKVGGVRQLVIPGSLAYMKAGSAPTIGPNAPLNFVISLEKVAPTKEPTSAPTTSAGS